jgi:hypothetical protein
MTYVSWGVLYEGNTDAAYFDILIPRIMEEIILARGTRHSTIPATSAIRLRRGSVEEVAHEACAAKEAFHLVFIHADTGGRHLESDLGERLDAHCQAMQSLCDWPPARCVTIAPRHETEAWVLTDPQAIASALGYRGPPVAIGLPQSPAQAERLGRPEGHSGAGGSRSPWAPAPSRCQAAFSCNRATAISGGSSSTEIVRRVRSEIVARPY